MTGPWWSRLKEIATADEETSIEELYRKTLGRPMPKVSLDRAKGEFDQILLVEPGIAVRPVGFTEGAIYEVEPIEIKELPQHLSDDQLVALKVVLESLDYRRETILTGPAGSGKTTLTQEIVRLATRSTVLATPTGKAATVLTKKSGREATTIHRCLYGRPFIGVDKRLHFGQKHAPCEPGELLLIDESSMVGQRLYRDIMEMLPQSARVLWIGDKEQLSPVNDRWGPDLDNATARLTKVHRQAAESTIIQYATAIREDRRDAFEATFKDDKEDLQVYSDPTGTTDMVKEAIEWLIHQRRTNEDATLLTYTHRIRERINMEVRAALGYSENLFTPGDKVVVRTNSKAGLSNGEVLTVQKAEEGEGEFGAEHVLWFEEFPLPLHTLHEHLEQKSDVFHAWKDRHQNNKKIEQYLHLHYGQCLTVHSSQGSQWKKAGFVWDGAFNRLKSERAQEGRRFLYTAVTRAEKELAIFMA